MTMTVIGVALLVGTVVAGGPMELIQVLNELAKSIYAASSNAVSVTVAR